jgi:hypothetical protein
VNKKRDPLEEILANTIKQQDDIVKYSIRQGEKIDFVMEKSHQLQFIRDPVTGGYMPITVCNLIYDVDENGKPLGRVTSTGFCRFGCKAIPAHAANTLFVSARTRSAKKANAGYLVGSGRLCAADFWW